MILSHLSKNSGGVAVLFSKDFLPLSFTVEEVIKGRLVVVRASYEHYNAILINVYAPTSGSERVTFLKEIGVILNNCSSEEKLFLGGDFNCTVNDVIDRNHFEPHAASQRMMSDIVETQSLVDIWREMHHKDRQYTWLHSRENIISLARLDRIYYFKHQINMVKGCKIVPVGFTDHSMVVCDVFVANIKNKSEYWHFNTSLLMDGNFKDIFVYFWKDFRSRKQEFASLRQWWDHGKVEIRMLCQQYTLGVTHDIIRSMNDLEMEVVELQVSADSTGNGGQIENLKSKRAALADLLGKRAQGALVRSRFQSATLMDSPSKYFFGLEKKNGQSRQFHALHSETGQLLTSSSALRQRAAEFYSQLYASEYEDDDMLFDSYCSDLSKLPEDVNVEVEGPLRLEEL